MAFYLTSYIDQIEIYYSFQIALYSTNIFNNAASFLPQDNTIVRFLRVESLIELFVFCESNKFLKYKLGHISFSFKYKIYEQLLEYFSQMFSNHLFLIDNLFLSSFTYLQMV